MGASRDPDAEQLDALRRRLYRPDATDADVQRYMAERSTEAPEPGVETSPAPRRSRLRPRLRRVLPAAASGGAVAVALVSALVLSLSQLHGARAAPTPVRTASSVPVLVFDIGDGSTLTVPQRASIRTESTPVAVDGAAVVGQRFEGSGNAIVVVEPPTGAMHGGVATVLATSSGPVPAAWRALALDYRGEWTAVAVVLARGSSAEPAGAIAPLTFRYRDAPPVRIAVIAPRGVRWSLLVGITGPQPALR